MAESGDEVTFTIVVENKGAQAAVNPKVVDTVPQYLEILEVKVSPELQEREPQPNDSKRIDGQTVTVYLKPLGQDYPVTIVIRTQLRVPEDAFDEMATPELVCIDNTAQFWADNCPDPIAGASPCFMPKTGGPSTGWTVVGGLGAIVLVLSLGLTLVRRERT